MSREYRDEFRVMKTREECPDTKTLFLDSTPEDEPMPGQFFMLNIPGVGERPFSPSYTEPLAFTFKKAVDPDTGERGKVSSHMLDSLKEGDLVELLGPKGNCFLDFLDPSRPICLVAGGCGAAPLRHFAEYLKSEKYTKEHGNPEVRAFLGYASQEELLFMDEFSRILGPQNIVVGIDEPGRPGKVVELMHKAGIERGAQVYVCGPRPFLKEATMRAVEYTGSKNIIVSTEPIMKCGRGVCGSCEVGGYHACQDGPSFSYETLRETEFFHYRRKKSGLRVAL